MIENCGDGESHPGLPVCLAEKVTVRRDLRVDEPILLEDLESEPEEGAFELWRKAIAESARIARGAVG